ncbi:tRNA pseudouridine synthase, putative [Plasmodium malariae]|uniref:tRNA pseudouridine synthase, putative n=3 Tax=Plasmodium (Plasmodium) TaxID=418103 RepID=A0A1D3RI59_PLAMA|nr:tRNA pseudouridine synthase, putative [Plasmodium malariae]SCN44864.1 tRNA pseudouridine synthase, putative [Plasmodium malariae]
MILFRLLLYVLCIILKVKIHSKRIYNRIRRETLMYVDRQSVVVHFGIKKLSKVKRENKSSMIMSNSADVNIDTNVGANANVDANTETHIQTCSPNREKLTNILIVVDFDGTNYSGWTGVENGSQVYLNAVKNYKSVNRIKKKDEYKFRTVQNTLLNSILKIHGYYETIIPHLDTEPNSLKPFDFIGVSRTDKGVHAKEYICQYISYERKPPCNGNMIQIKRALNSILNKDIKVLGVLNSPCANFNVRYHNFGKIYVYNLDVRVPSQPFERNYAWQLYDDPRFSFLLKKNTNCAGISGTSGTGGSSSNGGCGAQGKSSSKCSIEPNLNFLFDENVDSCECQEVKANRGNCIDSLERLKIENQAEDGLDSILPNKQNCVDNMSSSVNMNECPTVTEKKQMDDQVDNQMDDQVDNQMDDQVDNQMDNQVDNQMDNQVDNQMGNQVDNQMDNQVIDLFNENLKSRYANITHSLNIMNNVEETRLHISCDIDKIKKCSKLFVGYHNFECFRSTLKGTEKLRKINTYCNIHFLDVYKIRNNLYQFVIQGDRFLYHMVRIIIGTLVQIGVGLLKIQDVKDALYSSIPLKVKLCAPSQGLCLSKVLFPPALRSTINASILSN